MTRGHPTTMIRLYGALRAPIERRAAQLDTTPGDVIRAAADRLEVTPWPGDRKRLPQGCEPWVVRVPISVVQRFAEVQPVSLSLSWTLALHEGIEIS